MTAWSLDMGASNLRAQLSIGLVLIGLFAIHLPEGAIILLLPSLLTAYLQRASLHIDREIKWIGVLLIGYVLLFTLMSHDPARSAKGAYDIVRGLLAFFPAVWLGQQLSKAQGKSIGVFIGLLFILANFAFPVTFYGQTFFGFHDNPNNSAVTLTAYLFLLLGLFVNPKAEPRRAAAFAIAFCAALILLAIANSRGTWLGLAAAFAISIMLRPDIPRRIKLALILAAGACLLALLTLADWKGFGYGTVGARLKIWSGLWDRTVPDHMWFGYGINYVKDLMMASGLPELTAHNIFLELFVSTGLVGLALFAYIAWRLAAFLLRQAYMPGPVLYAGVGGLTAFLVMGQFDLKFASFKFIATVSCFVGLIYSQRIAAPSSEAAK